MRLGNLDGRLVVVHDSGVLDVAHASDGRFDADPALAYARWDELTRWVETAPGPDTEAPDVPTVWGSPTPRPPQIIAIGINSRIKLRQVGLGEPTGLGFISKLWSALGDPFQPLVRTSDRVLVETEVAVVIGRTAWQVDEADALSHVAGISVAEDLADLTEYVHIRSEREGIDDVVYYNPSKSLPGFAPVGPHLVTLDEVDDVNDLRLTLEIDGRTVQDGRTRDFLFSVPEIIARLSRRVPLQPGDVILTGSPGQLDESPLEPLQVGSTIVSGIVGVGRQEHRIVAPD